MGRRVSVFAVALMIGPSVFAQERAPARRPAQSGAAAAAARGSGTLPVRRVVLYKTGVGYFEHLGSIRNRQDVTIRFTCAQLNDVLKSLTTIDMGNGQVTGISYNSIAPIEQRLGALRLPLGETSSRIELLAALRGARLEVTSASGVVTGRLLSVERTTRTRGEDVLPTDDLSLVTDGGDLRSFELTPAVHVRILDNELRQDVSRYQLATLDAQLKAIVEDQQRLRENMKALRGSAEEKQLLLRYTRQLDEQENRLEALRRDIAATTGRRDAARLELNARIGSFTFEG